MAIWVKVDEYVYTGSARGDLTAKRRAKASELGAVGIFETRYELDAGRLPAKIRRALAVAGLGAVRIGSTTYRSSTWAVVPK